MRIKSILAKYAESGKDAAKCKMKKPQTQSEKALMLEVAKFNNVIETAFEELAPHKICAYIYDLSNAFNRFYQENEDRKAGFIALLLITKRALEACIDMLGFEAPERM